MNKEKFLKLKINTIKCRDCERNLDIKNFAYNTIHEDNTGICRSCQWIKLHNDKIEELKKEYSENLIIDLIRYIYESDEADLRYFANLYRVDIKTIIDINSFLKIGNKKIIVKDICEYCGKDAEYPPSAYLTTRHHYCSHECYYKDKARTSPHGEDSIYYNRISTKCSNCGKPIQIIPSEYKRLNRFGDNNNFCSQNCYWQYRSKYYRGEKSNKDLINWTPELIEKMRINKAKAMSGDNRLNTKPQIIVNDMLNELGIKYTREYNVKYYSIDNYLDDYNLMIEVMGDYWHANPLRYNNDKYGLNEKQLEGIHRDKLKYSYIKNHYNIEILYLWETDILKFPQLCKKLISHYVSSNGAISNYNSFNYSLYNDKLVLNSNIITPYKDMDKSKYKILLRNNKVS